MPCFIFCLNNLLFRKFLFILFLGKGLGRTHTTGRLDERWVLRRFVFRRNTSTEKKASMVVLNIFLPQNWAVVLSFIAEIKIAFSSKMVWVPFTVIPSCLSTYLHSFCCCHIASHHFLDLECTFTPLCLLSFIYIHIYTFIYIFTLLFKHFSVT